MRPLLRAAPLVLASLFAASAANAATDIPVKSFTGISLKGGGHVVLKYGPTQRVTLLKGSTTYTTIEVRHGNDLQIEACNAQCLNYDLEIEIVTPEVEALAVKGGGEIESAAGFPRQNSISAAVAGGGEIDLHNVAADEVNAAVSGGGDISVRAERSLHAAVNGGGGITYWGNPAVTQAVNGGGEIVRGS
jgi:hypothetical protein